MPRVSIKTGLMRPDGREEELSEYICDVTGCPNVASHVLGCVKELGVAMAVCNEHMAARKASPPPEDK